MANHGSPVMRKPDKNRFHFSHKTTGVPGPGNYTMRDSISNGGRYILSSFKSQSGVKWSKGERLNDLAKKKQQYKPGPGAYELPSDFGSLL